MYDLNDSVAVVTGAAGLIGTHYCAALASAGATVVAVDLDEDRVRSLASSLGPRHLGVAVDITNPTSVTALREHVQQHKGHVDILVNNAAINDMVEGASHDIEASKYENYPLELFRQVIDVNVTGMFLMCQSFGPEMAKQGRGSIINIASTYGVVAPDQSLYREPDGTQSFYKGVAYPVSKGAVLMLTKYLASYWGRSGVRVNTLSPGGVENGQPDHFINTYSDRTPLGRMADAEDYAEPLLFLASDASRYMTGHNLVVDGGFTIW
ncbi:MAG: SDR family oxidoreductase [Ignavibacteriae bacterium]|nr:MAG: SDR family oxidoreductase [Ignavibacteriota bacterium]